MAREVENLAARYHRATAHDMTIYSAVEYAGAILLYVACRVRSQYCANNVLLDSRGRLGLAIAVLMPFHSMTTTDSVDSISGGLAKSPSEVLNPPSSSLKAASGRV